MSNVLEVQGLHAGYGAGDILKGVELTVAEGSVDGPVSVAANGEGEKTACQLLHTVLRQYVTISENFL